MRKFLFFVLAAGLLFTAVIQPKWNTKDYASYVEHTEQPKNHEEALYEETFLRPVLQQCGNCGRVSLHPRKTYGNWVLTAQEKCEKEWNRSDDVEEREVTKEYVCSFCGYCGMLCNFYQTKKVCIHK